MSYGKSWSEANIPTALGIPDVSGDGVPDIWARLRSDGHTRIYNPSRTDTGSPVKVVLTVDWNAIKAFG
ncbi:hypothetical protein ACR6C2_13535 [Streptomyces sp. INA 01156]